MGVLHFLDVGIGFALGMMVLATLIGTAAGVWLGLIRSRTRQVETALATLVRTLGTVDRGESEAIAGAMLSDSWVKTPFLGNGAAMRFLRSFSPETIHREEFAVLLLRKAGEGHAQSLKAVGMTAAEASELLARVERSALELEAQDPHLPAPVWRTRALNQHAGPIASRLFSQFDNIMDRVEDNVAFSAKAVAAVMAAIFLAGYPVNSLGMIERLSTDEQLRTYLVDQAKADPKAADLPEKVKASRLFGDAFDSKAWDFGNLAQPGVLLTWVMVSLGAPFWLGLLNKLLGVRSEVAMKAQQQRALRETDQS